MLRRRVSGLDSLEYFDELLGVQLLVFFVDQRQELLFDSVFVVISKFGWSEGSVRLALIIENEVPLVGLRREVVYIGFGTNSHDVRAELLAHDRRGNIASSVRGHAKESVNLTSLFLGLEELVLGDTVKGVFLDACRLVFQHVRRQLHELFDCCVIRCVHGLAPDGEVDLACILEVVFKLQLLLLRQALV